MIRTIIRPFVAFSFLLLLFISFTARADQYFTYYSDAWSNCQSQINQYNILQPNTFNMTCTDRPQYPDVIFQQWYKSNGSFVQFLVSRYTNNYCTASGSTYSTSIHNCENSSCSIGQIANLHIGACQIPPVCNTLQGSTYDNITNTCSGSSCPANQSWQVTAQFPSGGCLSNPNRCDSVAIGSLLCSDTAVTCYDVNNNLKTLSMPRCTSLSCTGNTIPDPLNTNCVPAPTAGCPFGQHANPNPSSINDICLADDPTACGPGSRYGFINGIKQCIPIPKDAAQQAAQTPIDNSTPPPTTINTENGVTTSTTVNKDANGTITGTSTTTGTTKIDLNTTGMAQDNSVQAINKTLTDQYNNRQSGGGGDCVTAPVCTGDAINCAILQQSWKSRCNTDASGLSQSSITGNDISTAMGTTANPGTNTVDLSSYGFSTSGYGLSQSDCPVPITTQVYAGKTMTIDFSFFCDLATIIGNLLMITAFFISLRILIRG